MKKAICLLLGLLLVPAWGYSQKKHTIRLMSYNIQIGMGMDRASTNLERTADVINQIKPDYVGLQEVDSVAERSGWVDQAKELARLTGMHYVFAPATPRSKGMYGIAVLSKEEPLSYERIPLPGAEEPRTAVIVEFKDFTLYNLHNSLRAPSRKESFKIINKAVDGTNKPTLITGDFNMLPQSDDFEIMNENWVLLSDTTQRTHPADKPLWTLDYIFGYKNHHFEVLDKVVVPNTEASDHRPIYIDVKF